MVTTAVTDLAEFLRTHRLLEPKQLDVLERELQPRFSDPRALVRELVHRDWLTAYQADLLAQGRGAELLVGPYQVIDRLGGGGMGQVYKARHARMDRQVALKVVHREKLTNPAAVERFYREAKAAAQLAHPNIVMAYEVGEAGGTHYFAMEYVEGTTLSRLLEERGPLPIDEACEYARQAALGLEHAHEHGVVHRDIKPQNLMIVRSAELGVRSDQGKSALVKILDFGLARFESETEQRQYRTQVGKILGTVEYIAPEQAQNARRADIRSDIYSLGCTLYRALTGKLPFGGADLTEKLSARLTGEAPPVRELRPEVPAELERVLRKMLARDPGRRYQTPAEVAAALAPFSSAAELVVPPPVTYRGESHEPDEPIEPRRALGRSRRRRWLGPVWQRVWPWAAGALGAVGLTITIIALMSPNDQPSPTDAGTRTAFRPPILTPPATLPETGTTPNPPVVPVPNPPVISVPTPSPPPIKPKPSPFPATAEIATVDPNPTHREAVSALALWADRRAAVSAGAEGDVHWWDLSAGKVFHTVRYGMPITALAVNPARGWQVAVAYIGDTSEARLIDPVDKREVILSRMKVFALAFSPDGETVAWGDDDGVIAVRDNPKGQVTARCVGHEGRVLSVAFDTSGTRLVSSAADKTIRGWDAATGNELGRIDLTDRACEQAAFTADSRTIIASAEGGGQQLRLFDTETGELMTCAVKLYGEQPRGFVLSGDRRRVLIVTTDGGLRLFELESGQLLSGFRDQPQPAQVAALAADGRHGVFIGTDRVLRSWRLAEPVPDGEPEPKPDR